MQVKVAPSAGFCFGVKRAIEMALKRASEANTNIFTLGPIIHNPQVVQWLAERGVVALEEPPDKGTLLIRTHGVTKDKMEQLRQTGIDLIDATCPYVKKAQKLAENLSREGYQIIILGDREHPEVKGIKSYAGEDAIVVNSAKDLPLDRIKRKVGVVVQTTRPQKALQELVTTLVPVVSELRLHNTICGSTSQRQAETREIAQEVDIMVVVGGKNSANTKQLAHLCEALGRKTYHIETAQELSPDMFKGATKVGVTAGASTAQWLIDEVVDFLRRL